MWGLREREKILLFAFPSLVALLLNMHVTMSFKVVFRALSSEDRCEMCKLHRLSSKNNCTCLKIIFIMSRSKGLNVDECLALLHQLDEDCTDGSENSDPDFPIPAENEILEESSDSSDSDSAFNEISTQPNVGVSANLRASVGNQWQIMDERSSIFLKICFVKRLEGNDGTYSVY
jgi:hypothetical protein